MYASHELMTAIEGLTQARDALYGHSYFEDQYNQICDTIEDLTAINQQKLDAGDVDDPELLGHDEMREHYQLLRQQEMRVLRGGAQ